jgi:hypothetical protein
MVRIKAKAQNYVNFEAPLQSEQFCTKEKEEEKGARLLRYL